MSTKLERKDLDNFDAYFKQTQLEIYKKITDDPSGVDGASNYIT